MEAAMVSALEQGKKVVAETDRMPRQAERQARQVQRVKPRLKGKSTLVRFADDAVMAFADVQDAKRVLDVLGKRLARYELTLHPDKTRFVDFRSYRPDGKDHPDTDGTMFTFLGFCHVWGK